MAFQKMTLRSLAVGCAFPIVLVLLIWEPVISFVRTPEDYRPPSGVVKEMATTPGDDVLRELHDIAVSFPSYRGADDNRAVQLAEQAIDAGYRDGLVYVPFDPVDYRYPSVHSDLQIAGFALPSLLVRAYEASGNDKYLSLAAQYVVDWAEFERGLLLPRGLLLNDHAISSRAIVTTELWRLYRSSTAFDEAIARELIRYVARITDYLMDEGHFEYRSNHGFMQNLALIHLATAFPSLPDAKDALATAVERLHAQMDYFVDEQGAILEHSASYQWNGIRRLSAAWRYLGMQNIPVAKGWIDRYEAAVNIAYSLRRPDRTLPVVGDTHDSGVSEFSLATFDGDGVVSSPLIRPGREEVVPSRASMVLPSSGLALFWDGLEHWPDAARLAQTVVHWGNFPSGIHKHADDFGIGIWARGVAWVRAVGSWPYIGSRRGAISWMSSNAPHFSTEASKVDRDSTLLGYGQHDALTVLDLERTSSDEGRIRRQFIKVSDSTWITIDNFRATTERTGEVVWRFDSSLSLSQVDQNRYELDSGDRTGRLFIEFVDSDELEVAADRDGTDSWNHGIVSGGDIVPAPAIRVRSAGSAFNIVTVLRFDDRKQGITEFDWNSPSQWSLTLKTGAETDLLVHRSDDQVVAERRSIVGETAVPSVDEVTLRSTFGISDRALTAYDSAGKRFSGRFQPMTERRSKVTVAVILAGVAQIAVFIITGRFRRRYWWPLVVAAPVAWIGLTIYLEYWFLA